MNAATEAITITYFVRESVRDAGNPEWQPSDTWHAQVSDASGELSHTSACRTLFDARRQVCQILRTLGLSLASGDHAERIELLDPILPEQNELDLFGV